MGERLWKISRGGFPLLVHRVVYFVCFYVFGVMGGWVIGRWVGEYVSRAPTRGSMSPVLADG